MSVGSSCPRRTDAHSAFCFVKILAVQQTTRKSLEKIKGMSEAKVLKIKEAAQKLSPAAFKTGSEVSVAREKVRSSFSCCFHPSVELASLFIGRLHLHWQQGS